MLHRGVVCAAILAGAVSFGAAEEKTAGAPGHVMLSSAELVWVDAPPALPRGAQSAVLSGDPGQAVPFTIRVKFPAGYKIAPHWHPTAEHVTVLSGVVSLGMGDAYDAKALRAMPAGNFSVMPAEMRHFAYTKDGATIQVHGMGPFTLTYVNPADDPRNAAAPAK